MSDTILIAHAAREFCISPDLAKKLMTGIDPIGRKSGGDLYSRAAFLTRLKEYRKIPSEPPEGNTHLRAIAHMLGIHNTVLYADEKHGVIKPAGQYRAAGNGRLISYYSIDALATHYQTAVIAKNTKKMKTNDMVFYGQLPKQVVDLISTANRAFNLARTA